ncbi:hypothetical protein [Haloparvum sedimenti]|uniref:hypothetical protein n=1 Tax=Haloparvum sedimenti TaxID=1678448 RepID=UPI00071E87F8|nr:hypothetical protein [Haloparvum sedimenti]
MEPQADDDMMYICSEDGLALTGRELRERAQQGERISPMESAGRVLHAWDVTDDSGEPVSREYVTTSGFLVSDEEVLTNSQAFAETYVVPTILDPDEIRQAAADAAEERSHGGLKKRHSDDSMDYLTENADALSEAMFEFQTYLSTLFVGTWENAHPYLVGRDHVYLLPIKGQDAVGDVRDEFVNFVTSYDDIDRRKALVLWEAADPFLQVNIDLYLDGEQVA